MREIKFRAWQKEHLEMCDVTAIDQVKGLLGFGNDNGKVDYWLDIEECELMQYTGLKDKKGVEIYEGDIVVWHDTHDDTPKGWSRTAIVKINPDLCFSCFKKGKDKWNHDFHYGNFIYKDTEKWLEVIGNIYENPELSKN